MAYTSKNPRPLTAGEAWAKSPESLTAGVPQMYPEGIADWNPDFSTSTGYYADPTIQSQIRAHATQWNAIPQFQRAMLKKQWESGGGFLGAMGALAKFPVIGEVLGGINEFVNRPGDLWNRPDQFFGKTAAGAAPFLTPAIGPWARVMGVGGNVLSSGAYKNPGNLVGAGAMLAAPFVGGGERKALNTAGQLYNGIRGGDPLKAGLSVAGSLAGGPAGGAIKTAASMMPKTRTATPGGATMPSAAARANALNQIGPYFGVQPFPGGPYADKGMGDLAIGNANTLTGAGTAMSARGQAGLPALGELGALGNMPRLMGEMAGNTGVADPFTGQGGSNDPYSLRPHEQEAFNRTADMVNTGRRAAISSLRQRMSAMGIDDPRAIAVAEAAINSGHDQMLADTHSNLMNQAFQNRQQQLTQFGQMLPELYGQQNQFQQQNIHNALPYLTTGMGGYERAAERNIEGTRYNQAQMGRTLANLYPNLFGNNALKLPQWAQPNSPTGIPQGATGVLGGVAGAAYPWETPPTEEIGGDLIGGITGAAYPWEQTDFGIPYSPQEDYSWLQDYGF